MMRTTATTLFTLILCAGVAGAGDDTKTKTAPPPPAKKADAKPAPATKAAPAAKADPKTAAKPAPSKEAAAPGMPEKPTIPTALVDATKTQRGTWRCTGAMMGPDGNEAYKTKMTGKVKADLDNMWLRTEFAETKSKAAKYPFKFHSYTTFSDKDQKWKRVMVDNWGGVAQGWSTGPDATGKVTWEMDMASDMGTAKFRDYEEPVAGKKREVHMWGEMSPDKGKTWMKVYDITCKK